MQRPEQSSLVLIGIPSMFLVFSVLAMVILALLSYGTSRSDVTENRTAYDQTIAYYEACDAATDLYEEFSAATANAAKEATDAADFLTQLRQLAPEGLAWDSENSCFVALIPFSESQGLLLSLVPDYETASLTIRTWKTVLTQEWVPDSHFPLYTPQTTASSTN